MKFRNLGVSPDSATGHLARSLRRQAERLPAESGETPNFRHSAALLPNG
ncbi:MAG: hypothetical protein H0X34_03655 [Chthoniobacterales bacterium]|nr:hypothetical protein [Chthoniobacterales bacterium]